MAHALEAARIFALYVLPAVVGCGSVAFCALLVRRMKHLHGKLMRGEEELKTAKATWMRGMEAVGKEIETMEASAKQSKNGSADLTASAATRRKVLKMHRLGSSAEQIARALRLTRGEVMLVLKVHTIILRPLEQTSGDDLSNDGTKTLKVLAG